MTGCFSVFHFVEILLILTFKVAAFEAIITEHVYVYSKQRNIENGETLLRWRLEWGLFLQAYYLV